MEEWNQFHCLSFATPLSVFKSFANFRCLIKEIISKALQFQDINCTELVLQFVTQQALNVRISAADEKVMVHVVISD